MQLSDSRAELRRPVSVLIGQNRPRAAHRICLEAVWERENRRAWRLCHLPRFLLEPGRTGPMGEPSVLRGKRPLRFHRRRLCCSQPPRARRTTGPFNFALNVSNGFPIFQRSSRIRLLSRVRFSHRILTSSKAGCSSSTLMSNNNCPAMSCSRWVCRLPQSPHPGGRQQLECVLPHGMLCDHP